MEKEIREDQKQKTREYRRKHKEKICMYLFSSMLNKIYAYHQHYNQIKHKQHHHLNQNQNQNRN